MLFNEIEEIDSAFREAHRTLKKEGKFIFSVTHPGWDLFMYGREKAGVKSNKITGLHNYFWRGHNKYLMGSSSKNKPELAEEYGEFEVEHYQRTIGDYVDILLKHNFQIKAFIEPEISDELLKTHPLFEDYLDHPVGLILYGQKND